MLVMPTVAVRKVATARRRMERDADALDLAVLGVVAEACTGTQARWLRLGYARGDRLCALALLDEFGTELDVDASLLATRDGHRLDTFLALLRDDGAWLEQHGTTWRDGLGIKRPVIDLTTLS